MGGLPGDKSELDWPGLVGSLPPQSSLGLTAGGWHSFPVPLSSLLLSCLGLGGLMLELGRGPSIVLACEAWLGAGHSGQLIRHVPGLGAALPVQLPPRHLSPACALWRAQPGPPLGPKGNTWSKATGEGPALVSGLCLASDLFTMWVHRPHRASSRSHMPWPRQPSQSQVRQAQGCGGGRRSWKLMRCVSDLHALSRVSAHGWPLLLLSGSLWTTSE